MNTWNRLLSGLVASGLAIAGAATLAGCGASASSICSDVCECTGCSEEEEKDCVDDVEDQQKAAEDEGCGDQGDEVLSCYADQLECRDSEVDLDGCESEEKSLNNCMKGSGKSTGGGPGGDVCEEAADICPRASGSASGSASSSGEAECTGQTECIAQCIVDADSCTFEADSAEAKCARDCT